MYTPCFCTAQQTCPCFHTSLLQSFHTLLIWHVLVAAPSGYNGGPGSVGGNTYGAPNPYDAYGHSQHAYGSAAQPAAPSSPYGRQAGGGFGGGGFGSAAGVPANPYASTAAAAPPPSRSSVSHIACTLRHNLDFLNIEALHGLWWC